MKHSLFLSVAALCFTPSLAMAQEVDRVGVDTIVVIGQRTGPDYQASNASAATRTPTPLMETPTAVQVVPRAVLDDQGAVRVDRALENVSGVSLVDGQGVENFFQIRGFQTGDLYRDGVRARAGRLLMGPRETANVERIEVVKGPAAVLYGRLEPGGLINIVPERPLGEAYASAELQVGSEEFSRGTLDLSGPLGEGGALFYRLNGAYEQAGSFREFRENERTFLAPVLQWNIGPQTRALLEIEYLDSRDPLDYLNPVIGDGPIDLPRARNLGEAGSFMDTTDTRTTFSLAHAFSDAWRITFKYDHDDLSFDIPTQASIGGLVDPLACSLASCEVYRFLVGTDGDGSSDYASLELVGEFETGALSHTLLVGADYLRDRNDNVFQFNFFFDPIDMFNPVHTPVDPNALSAPDYRSDQSIRDTWRGYYIQDQIELPGNVFLLAGVRFDDTESRSSLSESLFGDPPTLTANSADEDATTPRFGVLWRPRPEFSLYANYVENFGRSNGRNADGALLPAQTAEQWEIGAKTEFSGGRIVASAALFDIAKQNLAVADPDPVQAAAGFQVAVGEVRHRGLELDVAGELAPGWRLIANYAYIDSEITRDAVASGGVILPGNTGNRLFGVPEHSGAIWTTYEFQDGALQGWDVGAGVVARSEREGDNANTFTLPGYATVNLMGRYNFDIGGRDASFQLNLDNVFDETYHTTAGSRDSGVGFGAPRSLLASLRVEY